MLNTEPEFRPASKVVHVAVAVITKEDLVSGKRSILIAKRPDHVHQGGLWEFPGGKVEQGESLLRALDRELFEELDIRLITAETDSEKYQASRPMIQIQHAYPDKTVFLDVCLVSRFSGQPTGKEGQALSWVSLDQLKDYRFPEANRPIVSACLLPERYYITPEYPSISAAESGLKCALSQHAQLIYLRQPLLAEDEYNSLVEALLQSMPDLSSRLMYQYESTLDAFSGAGLHLSVSRSKQLSKRPLSQSTWFAMSCHNQDEVDHAHEIGADFITLSPVLKTQTHPSHKSLGWSEFSKLTQVSKVPVYGLGGLEPKDANRLFKAGAQGLAGIRFWQTTNSELTVSDALSGGDDD
ncbi:MAG: Nudix family hydrolase [Oleiphilus sp.]